MELPFRGQLQDNEPIRMAVGGRKGIRTGLHGPERGERLWVDSCADNSGIVRCWGQFVNDKPREDDQVIQAVADILVHWVPGMAVGEHSRTEELR